MIFIQRDPNPSNSVLRALSRKIRGTGKTEYENARLYYAAAPPPSTCYPFSRYKTRVVCEALDEIYKNKCAYCESRYRATAARNIEHFRPKGGINECTTPHLGYWWLAGTWSNLLPSCLACNQVRKVTVFDPTMTLADIARLQYVQGDVSAGKGNAFPMHNLAPWANDGSELDAEDPLLINPSVRDPANHLVWEFLWETGRYPWESKWIFPVICPRIEAGISDPFGSASIGIYGLNRLGLVQERMEKLDKLKSIASRLVEAMEDLASAEIADEAKFKSRVNACWADLRENSKVECTYTAMSMAFIDLVEEKIKEL